MPSISEIRLKSHVQLFFSSRGVAWKGVSVTVVACKERVGDGSDDRIDRRGSTRSCDQSLAAAAAVAGSVQALFLHLHSARRHNLDICWNTRVRMLSKTPPRLAIVSDFLRRILPDCLKAWPGPELMSVDDFSSDHGRSPASNMRAPSVESDRELLYLTQYIIQISAVRSGTQHTS